MFPFTADWNFTPNSTGLSAPASTTLGSVVPGQSVTRVLMPRVKGLVTDCPFAAVTLAVKLTVPVAVGVPEMTPVPLVSDRPVGSAPLAIDQVYGVSWPLAASVTE